MQRILSQSTDNNTITESVKAPTCFYFVLTLAPPVEESGTTTPPHLTKRQLVFKTHSIFLNTAVGRMTGSEVMCFKWLTVTRRCNKVKFVFVP